MTKIEQKYVHNNTKCALFCKKCIILPQQIFDLPSIELQIFHKFVLHVWSKWQHLVQHYIIAVASLTFSLILLCPPIAVAPIPRLYTNTVQRRITPVYADLALWFGLSFPLFTVNFGQVGNGVFSGTCVLYSPNRGTTGSKKFIVEW